MQIDFVIFLVLCAILHLSLTIGNGFLFGIILFWEKLLVMAPLVKLASLPLCGKDWTNGVNTRDNAQAELSRFLIPGILLSTVKNIYFIRDSLNS